MKANIIAHIQEKQELADIAVQIQENIELTKQQSKEQTKLNEIVKQFSFLGSSDQSAKYNSILNNADKLGLAHLEGQFKKVEQSGNELRETFKRLKGDMLEADFTKQLIGDNASDEMKELLSDTKKYHAELQRIEKLSKQDSATFTKESRHAKDAKDLETLITTMKKYEQVNDKFKNNSSLLTQFQSITDAANALKASGDFSKIDVDGLRQKFVALDGTITDMGLKGQTVFGKLRTQMEKLGVYLSASAIMMGAWRQVKDITNNVIALDAKVTDLQVATGNSRQETEKLLKTYSEMGKQLGATTVDVANAADAWLRQGYSVAESNTLIKNSMMLSKLGQIDSAEATKALTSAMKGYKLTVEESMGVVDKFSSLDMKAAVSAGYIATAMAETATGARLAGIEMDRLAGYITTVGEVTQDGAESVGTFYRTLFARMGNIKVGRFIDDETGESLSDVESVLKTLGIALRDGEENFRNFGSVLDETYNRWDKFSKVDKNAIAVAFSGTKQQEKFLTLMDNYGQAMDYAETAANSAGTALDKYENTYLKGVEAAQDRFTAQFELLSKTILESGLITDTYDAGTGLLGFLTGIVDTLGTIPTLATVAAGALSSIGNKGKPVKISDGVRNYLMASKIYAQPLREAA